MAEDRMLNIRTTEELYRHLKTLCKEQGITYSDWLRRKIEEDANINQTRQEIEKLKAERDRLAKEIANLQAQAAGTVSKEEVERLRKDKGRLEAEVASLREELKASVKIDPGARMILEYLYWQCAEKWPREYKKPGGFVEWLADSVWDFYAWLGKPLGVSLGPYAEDAFSVTPMSRFLWETAMREAAQDIIGELMTQAQQAVDSQ